MFNFPRWPLRHFALLWRNDDVIPTVSEKCEIFQISTIYTSIDAEFNADHFLIKDYYVLSNIFRVFTHWSLQNDVIVWFICIQKIFKQWLIIYQSKSFLMLNQNHIRKIWKSTLRTQFTVFCCHVTKFETIVTSCSGDKNVDI